MSIAGGNMARRQPRFAICGRRADISIIVAFAGLITFLASVEETRRAEARDPAKQCEVRSITFSPDGTNIAAFVMNGRESGFSDSRPYDVSYSIALLKSEDLSKIATIPLDHIEGPEECCLAARNGVGVMTDLRAWYKSIAFSRDGKSLYVVDPKVWQIRTWSVASADWTSEYPMHVAAFGFALSEKSGLLAAIVAPNGVRIWDTDSGRELLYRPDWAPIRNWGLPAFSPGGKRFAVVTPQGVQLWGAGPEKLLATFLGHEMTTENQVAIGYKGLLEITSLEFSPTEESLAIGTTNGVRIVSVAKRDLESLSPAPAKARAENGDGDKAIRLDPGNCTRGLAFSPNGKYLATWDSSGRRFHDASNNFAVAPKSDYTTTLCAAFSPDGKSYAVGDSNGNLSIRDVDTEKELQSARFDR